MSTNLEYNDSFGHGYVITNSPHVDLFEHWNRFAISSFNIFVESRTNVGFARSENIDADIFLLGHPVDMEAETANGTEIASKAISILEQVGIDSLIKYVAYLGGRFSCVVRANNKILAIPDCHASQSIFWAQKDGFIAISSHNVLVARTLGSSEDKHARALMSTLRKYKQSGVRYYPGCRTSVEGVRPVFANCLLELEVDTNRAKHTRFYPFADLEASSEPEAIYDEFSHLLLKHIRLLRQLGPFAISLTAGKDSLTTLLAAMDNGENDFFTFTLHQYMDPDKTYEDMYVANDLAFKAGLQHKVLKWNGNISSSGFDAMFHQTWMHGGQARPFARALYEELPHEIFHYQSTAAETGTAFFTQREEKQPTAQRLTRLWQGHTVESRVEFQKEFDEFIRYAEFNLRSLKNLDYHDAFYWEHRNTSWAANRYHEGDLGQRVLLPFNQRSIIEAMLKMPLEERKTATLQKRFIADRMHLISDL